MEIVIEMESTEAAQKALDTYGRLMVWGKDVNEMIHVTGVDRSHAMKDGGVKLVFEDDFFVVGGKGVQTEIISSVSEEAT